MECPSCKGYFEVSAQEQKFFPLCGAGFPPEFSEELRKTFPSFINDFKTLPGVSPSNPSPPEHESASPSSDAEAHLSSDPGARAKEECALLLQEVFSRGRITPEDLLTLARREKALGIQNQKAIDIQKAVAEKLGLDIDKGIRVGDLAFASPGQNRRLFFTF